MKIGKYGSNRINNAGNGLTTSGNYTISGQWDFEHLTGAVMQSGNLKLNDNVQLQLGDGIDWRIHTSGTHLYIDQRRDAADDIFIRNTSDDAQFKFDLSNGYFLANGDVVAYSNAIP